MVGCSVNLYDIPRVVAVVFRPAVRHNAINPQHVCYHLKHLCYALAQALFVKQHANYGVGFVKKFVPVAYKCFSLIGYVVGNKLVQALHLLCLSVALHPACHFAKQLVNFAVHLGNLACRVPVVGLYYVVCCRGVVVVGVKVDVKHLWVVATDKNVHLWHVYNACKAVRDGNLALEGKNALFN